MDDADRVHVRNPLHDLLEEVLGVLLCELSALPHVVEEVATRAQLHHDEVVIRCLERLEQLDMARVLDRLQNVDLLHHLALSALLFDVVLSSRLDRDESTRQPVQAQVHLAEGALAKNLADLVELNARLWHLVVLFEAVGDHFGE